MVEQAVIGGERVYASQDYSWVKDDAIGGFSRQQTHKPDYWMLVFKLRQTILSLDIFRKAQSEVRADSLWSSHVDKLVGTPMSARRISLDDLLMGIPVRIVKATGLFDFSAEHFDAQVDDFEKLVHSKTVECVRTTPFYGICLTSELTVTKNVSFIPLDDDQLMAFLDLGFLESDSPGMGADFVHSPPRAAIISRFQVPKIVRGDNEDPNSENAEFLESLARQAVLETTAIELLTLILGATIAPIGSITETPGATSGWRQYQKITAFNRWALKPIELSEEVADEFRRYWPVVSDDSRKSKHYLAIALRRYALATIRPSLDDRLIDLMICAEAIFLRVESNELTYKLAHRAALFLGGNASSKKEVFKFFTDAYSMRSKVVHGSKSYLVEPKDIENLTQTTSKLSEHLREAILKMLAIAMCPHAPSELIDWKDLMFSSEANAYGGVTGSLRVSK